jgi:hypothetical protein
VRVDDHWHKKSELPNSSGEDRYLPIGMLSELFFVRFEVADPPLFDDQLAGRESLEPWWLDPIGGYSGARAIAHGQGVSGHGLSPFG